MITQQSLSKEIQCHHTISTRGLDILCIAAELDELESSDESANYCTSIENSVNNNAANQRNYKKRPPRRKICNMEGCTSQSRCGSDLCIKHSGKKSKCSVNGCGKNAQYKGFCRKHGGRKCSVEGCKSLIAYGGQGKCIKHAIQPKEFEFQVCTDGSIIMPPR